MRRPYTREELLTEYYRRAAVNKAVTDRVTRYLTCRLGSVERVELCSSVSGRKNIPNSMLCQLLKINPAVYNMKELLYLAWEERVLTGVIKANCITGKKSTNLR